MRKNNINLFFKGMSMGIADIIPGVSGGTIALILGIYEELLESISKINLNALKILKKEGSKSFWNYINGTFLIILFSGIITSIIILSKVILILIDKYPVLVWAFFFGLILSSIVLLIKDISKWNLLNIFLLIIFSILSYYSTNLNPIVAPNSNIYIFFSGFIAIIAMILPGISGSFILLLLGSYQIILSLLNDITTNFTNSLIGLTLFLSGCILGLISFSKILTWLFKKYYNATMSSLIGIMIGALNKIWPWKKIISYRVNSKGKEVPFISENIMPKFENNEDYIILAIFFCIIGFLIVLNLNKFNRKK